MKKSKLESILYVEDEKVVQEELTDILKRFCDELFIADDGFQALKVLKKHTPSLIISDIKMPLMDGLEMSKKIKEENNNIPIVFTTAFSDTEYLQEAIELQVEGYLLKPINLDLLEKKIIEIIDKIELKKELEEKEQMLIESAKLSSMGQMIFNIGHQWRQPLSAISSAATGMMIQKEENLLTDDLFYEECKIINTNAQYLSKTIDDFKDYFNPKQKF